MGAGGPVVVMAPMWTELRPIVARLGVTPVGAGAERAWTGSVGGAAGAGVGATDVVVVLAGVGPEPAREAATRAVERFAPGRVVVAGIAGAVDDALRIGDVVTASFALDATSGRSHPTSGPVVGREGGLVTTDGFLDPRRIEGFRGDGVVAVDMETSAVAEVCAAAGVPWGAIRAVSDRLADGLVDEAVAGLVGADGRPDVKALVRYLARRPWRVARLARLGRDTSTATAAAADAVAAYLELVER